MNPGDVFKAALVGYVLDGEPVTTAHFHALVVLRTYLAASPSPSAAKNAEKVAKYMSGITKESIPGQAALILEQEEDGRITRIPKPDCMESRLPLDRQPTDAEIEEAWSACCSSVK